MWQHSLGAVIEAQGRKQSWLAQRVGISQGYVSKIVAGTKTVDRPLGERIAVALGVPFGVLFEIHERNDSITDGGEE